MLDIPDPVKEQANAEAIGSACRQTGRSIEDCYTLNPNAQKAAVFSGWKSMNDYMQEHSLKEVPSVIPRPEPAPPTPATAPPAAVPPAAPPALPSAFILPEPPAAANVPPSKGAAH
ncbi:MAG: hypothetical protein LBG78_06135 [Azoarcus sp.]|nr:hypothetical protein [Azoarcus sp.]